MNKISNTSSSEKPCCVRTKPFHSRLVTHESINRSLFFICLNSVQSLQFSFCCFSVFLNTSLLTLVTCTSEPIKVLNIRIWLVSCSPPDTVESERKRGRLMCLKFYTGERITDRVNILACTSVSFNSSAHLFVIVITLNESSLSL